MAPASLSSVSDCSVSMKRNSATGSSKPTTPHSPKRRDSFLSPAAASAAPSLRLVSSSTNGSLHAVVDVVRLLEQRKVIDSALSPVAQDLDRLRPGRLMEATPALVDPPTPMTLRNPACGGGVMVTGGGDGVSELSQSDSNTIDSASMPIKKTLKEIVGRKTPSPVLDKHGTRTNNKMGSTATPSNSLNGDRLLNSQSAIRRRSSANPRYWRSLSKAYFWRNKYLFKVPVLKRAASSGALCVMRTPSAARITGRS